MRGLIVALGAVVTLFAASPAGAGAHAIAPTAIAHGIAPKALVHGSARRATAQPPGRAQQTLRTALRQGMTQAGGSSGAYVVDLSTGQALFSSAPGIGRIPASVEKLYTTSTALLRLGPAATLTTSVLGRGYRGRLGAWVGTLYLRGGGDPTFGSASFDQYAYGRGATMERLVGTLLHNTHITALKGRVVGDQSYFDSLPGTSESGYQFDPYMEGSLSALVFNRGLLNGGSAYVTNPSAYAAQQFIATLQAARVRVARRPVIGVGAAPASARLLAAVHSPSIAKLIALTNTPSDNFFAETLLKDLGARFGGAGTTAAGAAVVRHELASEFGIHPTLVDGSGLSRADSTSPRDVVTLLSQMTVNPYLVNSLAIGGETGTLQHEMQGTAAQGNCRGKTGTLSDVASLVGYCQAQDGHTLAFAFLMNSVSDSSFAHSVEANMAVALANYDG